MASTTIYTDGITVSSQPAGTYGSFKLMGGLYGVAVVTSGGSVTIQLVNGPDGATPVNVVPAIGGTGYESVYLPPGLYQVVIATATSSVAVNRIKVF